MAENIKGNIFPQPDKYLTEEELGFDNVWNEIEYDGYLCQDDITLLDDADALETDYMAPARTINISSDSSELHRDIQFKNVIRKSYKEQSTQTVDGVSVCTQTDDADQPSLLPHAGKAKTKSKKLKNPIKSNKGFKFEEAEELKMIQKICRKMSEDTVKINYSERKSIYELTVPEFNISYVDSTNICIPKIINLVSPQLYKQRNESFVYKKDFDVCPRSDVCFDNNLQKYVFKAHLITNNTPSNKTNLKSSNYLKENDMTIQEAARQCVVTSVQPVSRGVHINSRIFLNRCNWNCLVLLGVKPTSYRCALCCFKLPASMVTQHVALQRHRDLLDATPPLLEFGENFIRKVADSWVHCAICNTVITPGDDHIRAHLQGNKHTKLLQQAKQETSCKPGGSSGGNIQPDSCKPLACLEENTAKTVETLTSILPSTSKKQKKLLQQAKQDTSCLPEGSSGGNIQPDSCKPLACLEENTAKTLKTLTSVLPSTSKKHKTLLQQAKQDTSCLPEGSSGGNIQPDSCKPLACLEENTVKTLEKLTSVLPSTSKKHKTLLQQAKQDTSCLPEGSSGGNIQPDSCKPLACLEEKTAKTVETLTSILPSTSKKQKKLLQQAKQDTSCLPEGSSGGNIQPDFCKPLACLEENTAKTLETLTSILPSTSKKQKKLQQQAKQDTSCLPEGSSGGNIQPDSCKPLACLEENTAKTVESLTSVLPSTSKKQKKLLQQAKQDTSCLPEGSSGGNIQPDSCKPLACLEENTAKTLETLTSILPSTSKKQKKLLQQAKQDTSCLPKGSSGGNIQPDSCKPLACLEENTAKTLEILTSGLSSTSKKQKKLQQQAKQDTSCLPEGSSGGNIQPDSCKPLACLEENTAKTVESLTSVLPSTSKKQKKLQQQAKQDTSCLPEGSSGGNIQPDSCKPLACLEENTAKTVESLTSVLPSTSKKQKKLLQQAKQDTSCLPEGSSGGNIQPDSCKPLACLEENTAKTLETLTSILPSTSKKQKKLLQQAKQDTSCLPKGSSGGNIQPDSCKPLACLEENTAKTLEILTSGLSSTSKKQKKLQQQAKQDTSCLPEGSSGGNIQPDSCKPLACLEENTAKTLEILTSVLSSTSKKQKKLQQQAKQDTSCLPEGSSGGNIQPDSCKPLACLEENTAKTVESLTSVLPSTSKKQKKLQQQAKQDTSCLPEGSSGGNIQPDSCKPLACLEENTAKTVESLTSVLPSTSKKQKKLLQQAKQDTSCLPEGSSGGNIQPDSCKPLACLEENTAKTLETLTSILPSTSKKQKKLLQQAKQDTSCLPKGSSGGNIQPDSCKPLACLEENTAKTLEILTSGLSSTSKKQKKLQQQAKQDTSCLPEGSSGGNIQPDSCKPLACLEENTAKTLEILTSVLSSTSKKQKKLQQQAKQDTSCLPEGSSGGNIQPDSCKPLACLEENTAKTVESLTSVLPSTSKKQKKLLQQAKQDTSCLPKGSSGGNIQPDSCKPLACLEENTAKTLEILTSVLSSTSKKQKKLQQQAKQDTFCLPGDSSGGNIQPDSCKPLACLEENTAKTVESLTSVLPSTSKKQKKLLQQAKQDTSCLPKGSSGGNIQPDSCKPLACLEENTAKTLEILTSVLSSTSKKQKKLQQQAKQDTGDSSRGNIQPDSCKPQACLEENTAKTVETKTSVVPGTSKKHMILLQQAKQEQASKSTSKPEKNARTMTQTNNFIKENILVNFHGTQFMVRSAAWHAVLEESSGAFRCHVCPLYFVTQNLEQHTVSSQHCDAILNAPFLIEHKEHLMRKHLQDGGVVLERYMTTRISNTKAQNTNGSSTVLKMLASCRAKLSMDDIAHYTTLKTGCVHCVTCHVIVQYKDTSRHILKPKHKEYTKMARQNISISPTGYPETWAM